MGYTSSPSTSSSSTGNREMDELMKLFTQYMKLTAERQDLEEQLSEVNDEIEILSEKIRNHPNADQLSTLIGSATKKPNNNRR
jgi:hypothetical protein